MVAGGSAGHSDWHGSHSSLSLRHKHGPSWGPEPQVSVRPSVATGPTDINTGPFCCCFRASNEDLALGNSPDPVSTWN